MRTYSELVALQTFEERLRYLKLDGVVCDPTFGGHRHLNQMLYRSSEWHKLRTKILLRDNACDLADPDRPILGRVLIHHLNPITIDDVLRRHPCVFDPENLVCTTHLTHLAIHYGDEALLPSPITERKPNDTCPWK